MRKAQLLVSTLLLVLLLVACAPEVAPAPALQAPATAPAPAAAVPVAAAKPAWQVEWDKTVEAAKKEGALMHFTQAASEQRRALSEAFKSRFGVSIEWLAGSSAEIGVKILAERRARIYSGDVGLMGWSGPLTILKPAGALESLDKVLFLPELADPQEIQKVWRLGQLEWVDKDHTILAFAPYASGALLLNTQLVKPGEIRGFRDLLGPKWKGKIIMFDPTTGVGSGFTWLQAVSHIMGWDYLRQLGEQEPFLTRDRRLGAEWVARGKYAVALGVPEEAVKEFMDIGAPLKYSLPEEGGFGVAGNGVSILFKDAPHANAAKLYINWLLSKEGQTVYSKAVGVPSGRLDVSIEGLDPLLIFDPKIRYTKSYGEEVIRERPEVVNKAKEIFGKLTK